MPFIKPVSAPLIAPSPLAPLAPESRSGPAHTAIRVRNVGRRYRDRAVLDAISFEVAEGEAVGVAGVNGAGKTTLLRCLLDFATPDCGDIELFGISTHRPASRARVGFLPERFVPPMALTGHEVLQWLAGLHAVTWTHEASNRAFERFEIAPEAMNRPVGQFSKGMIQKLGLAAVLSSGKSLVILDEPMSGLDPIARRFVADALDAARDAGTTLLFTSHSPTDIERLCNRVLVMHDGRMLFDDTPQRLRESRKSPDLERAFIDLIQAQPMNRQP